MHKYIIMGPQGSGKGTQAKFLCEDLDLTHMAVGDIFRWNIQSHTKLAARIKRIMDEGKLVPDEIVEEIITSRLSGHDWNYGFVIDGFPRNRNQAEFFLESYDVDAVIHLDVPDEVTRKRVLARRKCSVCGLDYNLMFHRPAVEGVCDVCGGALIARDDDNEEALNARLHEYNTKTRPTLELFERKELVVHVDGAGTLEQVRDEIRGKLHLPQRPRGSSEE